MLIEYIYRGTVSIITYSIGFFLALFVNSYVGWRRNRRTYFAMIEAIKLESRSNFNILTNSFEKYIDNGIIVRDYNLDVVSKYVADPLFIRYAPLEYLEKAHKYIRTVRLGNLLREKHENMVYGDQHTQFDNKLIEALKANINDVKDELEEMLKLQRKAKGFWGNE